MQFSTWAVRGINAATRVLGVVVLSLVAVLGAPVAGAQCSGDINGDGKVDAIDLAIVLGQWGVCPPTITAVSPLQGSILGGTVITITGTGLIGTSEVTIGGAPCTGLTVLSPTQVKATTPPGAAGQAAIAVATPAGTSLAPTPFTYVLQSVTSITPSSGPFIGGTPITISGQFLGGTTSVTVGGVPATNVVVVDANTVTAVTPPGSVGAVDVVVTGTKGAVTASGGFTYLSVITPPWATLLEALPDPAVVADQSLREAIISTGLAWRVRDNASQIEMLLVPPGTFDMGCSPSNQFNCVSNENPVHEVTITSAFYVGRYEVTQAQWAAVMGSNPSSFQGASSEVPAPQLSSRPVEQVSWDMAQGFLSATGLRLLTEAEWEYVYRAGTSTAFHSMPGFPIGTDDDTQVASIAWLNANSAAQPRPVGQKAANALGLHDMSGNVWEWVNDFFGSDYYSSSPSTDPPGPVAGSSRVLRGGGWANFPNVARSSYRGSASSNNASNTHGVRVARFP